MASNSSEGSLYKALALTGRVPRRQSADLHPTVMIDGTPVPFVINEPYLADDNRTLNVRIPKATDSRIAVANRKFHRCDLQKKSARFLERLQVASMHKP